MTNSIQIVATGLPVSIEDYQLALNAAFAGGKAYGMLKERQACLEDVQGIMKSAENSLEKGPSEYHDGRWRGSGQCEAAIKCRSIP